MFQFHLLVNWFFTWRSLIPSLYLSVTIVASKVIVSKKMFGSFVGGGTSLIWVYLVVL